MSNTELSEFFSLVSKEKNENLEQLKNKIKNPESDLSNFFEQLENAHKETTKVSEEISVEKILTEGDQNRLEVFSNLMNSMNSVKELPEEVKVVHDVELKEIEEPEEIIPEEIVKTDNIISDIVDALDEMGEKTEVKEEIDQISALRRDFDNFKNLIQRDISNQQMSGAGSGEVRLEFLDDVNTTGQEDGDVLTYNATAGKYELKSSTSTVSAGQLLEETDGNNIVFTATDASGSDEGDDVLLESGVGGSRDIDQTVLQILTTDIIPQQGEKFNLGSSSHRFKNLYLSSETIDLGGATISSDGSGTITISADGATLPVGNVTPSADIVIVPEPSDVIVAPFKSIVSASK